MKPLYKTTSGDITMYRSFRGYISQELLEKHLSRLKIVTRGVFLITRVEITDSTTYYVHDRSENMVMYIKIYKDDEMSMIISLDTPRESALGVKNMALNLSQFLYYEFALKIKRLCVKNGVLYFKDELNKN